MEDDAAEGGCDALSDRKCSRTKVSAPIELLIMINITSATTTTITTPTTTTTSTTTDSSTGFFLINLNL